MRAIKKCLVDGRKIINYKFFHSGLEYIIYINNIPNIYFHYVVIYILSLPRPILKPYTTADYNTSSLNQGNTTNSYKNQFYIQLKLKMDIILRQMVRAFQ